jgi:GNAT superfamily N-acetyltransferase
MIINEIGALPGEETLLASWQALTLISPAAKLLRSRAATAAVFPSWAPLNNAILTGASDGNSPAVVATQLTRIYADAGIDSWALWLPSRVADLDAPDDLRHIEGLRRDATTLVMQADLSQGLDSNQGVVRTSIASAALAGDEPVPAVDLEVPDRAGGLSAWVLVQDGLAVAGAWSLQHETDCGIYAVGTAPGWRRRGVARALVEHVLSDAYRSGSRTATLQSTPMAQQLYETLGFEPVGRYEEWVAEAAGTGTEMSR